MDEINKDYVIAAQPKSRTIAVLLALFLGGIGAHRFYLGKTRSGILYLLFFWSFVPALIAFCEAIRWLCMSNQGFAERYKPVVLE